MKSVLISIKPKWCELIANGKKTVEVRKTKPKLDTPFKCYIYCTKPKNYYKISSCMAATDENLYLSDGKIKMSDGFEFWAYGVEYEHLNGKVIGEFVCNAIYPISITYSDPNSTIALREFPFTCLTDKEIIDYLGNGNTGYGWHISNLVIYDKPRELRDFHKYGVCPCSAKPILHCTENMSFCAKRNLTRPPQSWCYVESEVERK